MTDCVANRQPPLASFPSEHTCTDITERRLRVNERQAGREGRHEPWRSQRRQLSDSTAHVEFIASLAGSASASSVSAALAASVTSGNFTSHLAIAAAELGVSSFDDVSVAGATTAGTFSPTPYPTVSLRPTLTSFPTPEPSQIPTALPTALPTPAPSLILDTDCDFDSGWCAWTPNEGLGGSLAWDRTSGSTPTFNTGPSSDHTTGGGSYAFIEASGYWPDGGPFTLESPPFVEVSGVTVEFWSAKTLFVFSECQCMNNLLFHPAVASQVPHVW